LELYGFVSGKRGETEGPVMYTMLIRLINNVVTVLWPRITYKTSWDKLKKNCQRLGIIGIPSMDQHAHM
jgi:hypothetical protein